MQIRFCKDDYQLACMRQADVVLVAGRKVQPSICPVLPESFVRGMVSTACCASGTADGEQTDRPLLFMVQAREHV